MRYAPTVFCLIVGWGGDFFACSLMLRAYAIRPYTYSLNYLVRRRFLCVFDHVEGVCPCASYTCSLNHWVGRRFLCVFAHMEGVCDTPLHLFT